MIAKDTENVLSVFGSKSKIFQDLIDMIKIKFNSIRGNGKNIQSFDIWKKNVFPMFSKSGDKVELFIQHTYLILITEKIISYYLKNFSEISILNEIPFFQNLTIKNNPSLSEIYLISEINDSSIISQIDEKFEHLITGNIFDNIDLDIFSQFYQDIMIKDNRHQVGEFFTPKWLIDLILDDMWPEIEKNYLKNNSIKILDPSCGSGSFLVNTLTRGIKNGLFLNLSDIFQSVHGYDINPISLFMASVNYLISIPKNMILCIKKESLKDLMINPLVIINSIAETNPHNKISNYFDKIENKLYDYIFGNPPWISLRSIGNIDYQNQIKGEYFKYRLIEKKNVHLFTQMELASLFFVKVIDLFLKKNGKIIFIMPKSVITGSKHNINFRLFKKPVSKLLKIWDLQPIKDLFGMPACVLFSQKDIPTEYPVDLFVLFNTRTFSEVEKYHIPESNLSHSPYYNKFKVGASIFPRNLYFIEFVQKKNDSVFQIKTDDSINAIAKKEWKNIQLEGQIQTKFLFCTLLAWELLPFGYTKLRTIVLPIHIVNNTINLIFDISSEDEISSNWFKNANEKWKKNQTEKSGIRFPDLLDRLNFNQLLIKQNINKSFIVLYSGTGSNICSTIINKSQLKNINFNNELKFPFIVDVKTWFYESDIFEEVHYLCACLNSSIINKLIKPLQPQGLGGARAIHRRPLQFPIPEYDSTKLEHQKLATLSIQAHEQIDVAQNKNKSVSRKQSREILKELISEIDELIQLIMK